jgi:hypothetical protein
MALLGAAIVLAGCSSQVRGTGEQGMSDEESFAKRDAVCKSFGLQPSTTEYADCLKKLRHDRSFGTKS